MPRTLATGAFAAIGGLTAAVVALLTGPRAATADELADLRANQELLQKRIDQLSQAPPQAAPYVPGFGPETVANQAAQRWSAAASPGRF